MTYSYFLKRLKDVSLSDLFAFFPMMVAILLYPFLRNKYKDFWLIADRAMDARDNGFHFFRYMKREHPEQKCVFALKRKSIDYQKIASLGETVEFGSVMHWIAYFSSRYVIFSARSKPNSAWCHLLELMGFLHPDNVDLQHGITINDVRGMYADRMRCALLVTSTVDERDFIERNFGHPKGVVRLTGFPRFDALHDTPPIRNRIVIMPTWRMWFEFPSQQGGTLDDRFETSQYFLKWKELLISSRLDSIISQYNLEIIFYPHHAMQKYMSKFDDIRSNVKIASLGDSDVQELLKTASLLITDYSSVFFDMVYMKRPIIFYQFDEKDFREHHHGKGYFDYNNNLFGKSFHTIEGVLDEMEKIICSNYIVNDDYLKEHKRIFKYWDCNNSKRIYEILKNVE